MPGVDKVHWVSCVAGEVPSNAVPAGRTEDGIPIYAIRASHRGDMIPGHLVANKAYAFVSWGGDSHTKVEYEVLISYDIAWVPSSDGAVPEHAFVAGSTSNGENLYFGRALHEGVVSIGKVHPTWHCLFIPHKDKEISIKEYEIMILR